MDPTVAPQDGAQNSNLALAEIRRLIDRLIAAGDQRLPPERRLAEDFKVGRRAVRRALEVLDAEGVLRRRHGSGNFIALRSGPPVAEPPGETALFDIAERSTPIEVMEVRLHVEPALARLAALKARRDDIEQLRRLADKAAASEDADGHELWDGAFHRKIAQAAGNSLFLALFDAVDHVREHQPWRVLRQRARSQARHAVYIEHHERIVQAIAARDAMAAGAAMREHLRALQEALTACLTEDGNDGG
ncbi:FadR/GntR family transcriptional regulator [Telmatospirillum siberiense]|uniref:GntR family transcriptional regulator n=1 Tax=Telmatospirillum siberiense TaxID=382514 RepID=A0A2N3PN20_9PROT|nr:FCD domain-containing protein [Telmatospirillum siberiense]PKU21808.1 GntR family transcriptional regulator [Telmatospirillum siberiense]